MTIRSGLVVLAMVAGIGALTACMTPQTVDVTLSPFRATSDVTEGITDATTDLTQPVKEFTSSTSPKSGTVKTEHKVRAFAVLAFENVKDDVAQGSGEYLASFATLVGIPSARQSEFFRFAQEQYGFIYEEGIRPAESVNRLIHMFSDGVKS